MHITRMFLVMVVIVDRIDRWIDYKRTWWKVIVPSGLSARHMCRLFFGVWAAPILLDRRRHLPSRHL